MNGTHQVTNADLDDIFKNINPPTLIPNDDDVDDDGVIKDHIVVQPVV